MSLIVVDVESDGEVPPIFSMICFGAVIVDPELNKTFYAKVKPISPSFKPDVLAISGFTRDEHWTFEEPEVIMGRFADWILANSKGKPVFISDNPCYDWQFINYYFHRFYNGNPFGFSGRRIGDLYCGMVKDMQAKWKHLRNTKHDHNPINDALGNAEALLKMRDMGIKMRLG